MRREKWNICATHIYFPNITYQKIKENGEGLFCNFSAAVCVTVQGCQKKKLKETIK